MRNGLVDRRLVKALLNLRRHRHQLLRLQTRIHLHPHLLPNLHPLLQMRLKLRQRPPPDGHDATLLDLEGC